MGNAVVTGSGSGIGAAIKKRLEAEGFDVVGVDIKGAEITADLSKPSGRNQAIRDVLDRTRGSIDRLVTCAGLGSNVRPPSLVAAVNYYGSVELLDGLFDAMTKGQDPAAIAIVSNSAQMAPLDDSPFARLCRDACGVCPRACACRAGPAYAWRSH